MPKNKRDFIKQHIGNAYFHLGRAGIQLNLVHDEFLTQHPDDAELILYLMEGIGAIIENIDNLSNKWWCTKVKEREWRNLPPDVDIATYGEKTGEPEAE